MAGRSPFAGMFCGRCMGNTGSALHGQPLYSSGVTKRLSGNGGYRKCTGIVQHASRLMITCGISCWLHCRLSCLPKFGVCIGHTAPPGCDATSHSCMFSGAPAGPAQWARCAPSHVPRQDSSSCLHSLQHCSCQCGIGICCMFSVRLSISRHRARSALG